MKPVPLCVSVLLILLPACSEDRGTTPDPGDTTPPSWVRLAVESSTGSVVTLSWTAPGDDGTEGTASRYDIRYSTGSLAGAEWDSATAAVSPPAPKPSGETESFAISGLRSGNWKFALKCADEVPNWSALSNVVSANVRDSISPSAVIDLAVDSVAVSSVTLTWTASGNDGDLGQASAYELRYALVSITEETWDNAVRVQGVPAPDSAGSQEFFTVPDLELATNYFFAVKAVDRTFNWSELSNVVSASPLSLVRLTFSPAPNVAGAATPAWSPDSRTIAFAANWEGYGSYAVYLMPATGGTPAPLIDSDIYYWQPSWSPDGKELAIVGRGAPNHVQGVWIMRPVPGSELSLRASHGQSTVDDCAWSPDGERIAYSVTVSSGFPTTDIYFVPAAGGATQLLIGGPAKDESPTWSPDGTQIAFMSTRSGSEEIWIVPASGGFPVQLTDDPDSDADSPAWSPDGTRIAYTRIRMGNGDLWIMSATGENPTPLTFDSGDDRDPCWSPDGHRIAFTSRRHGRNDIWVLDLN